MNSEGKRKKKVRVWGKINLFETSAVGIAAYPDAHLSHNEFSLIKALSESGDELNKGEHLMPEEETPKAEETVEETKEETTEEETTEEPEKVEEEESSEEEPEETEKKVEPVTLKDISKMIGDAVKDAMKAATPERGLVIDENSVKKELESKSLGEIAMGMGLFKVN